MTEQLLKVVGLGTRIQTASGIVRPVDEVDIELRRGETLAVVGESGCGKSMLALSIMRLLPDAAYIASGSIQYLNTDLLSLPERDMRDIRGRGISMIFQEPSTSLNPVMTIGSQIGEVLERHAIVRGRHAKRHVIELLESVGIPAAAQRCDEYPFQMSGGMKQRVMIAMALAAEPAVLIADEPTTALDVTLQAQVLALLKDQQLRRGMAMLLITHDLGVVSQVADRVAVMYAGQVIESAKRTDFIDAPRHPYSSKLFGSLPDIVVDEGELAVIPGQVPDLTRELPGCRFADRCEQVQAICRQSAPRLEDISPLHQVRCLRAKELGPLTGVHGINEAGRQGKAAYETTRPLLMVNGMRIHFPIRKGLLRRTVGHVKAVDGVSIEVQAGRTVALVGESGCGKTTIGKAIVQLVAPTDGFVFLEGTRLDTLRAESLRRLRRDFQIVFQDPYASLNPRMRIEEILAEVQLSLGKDRDKGIIRNNSQKLLHQVGLGPEALGRYPHEFSGGQRQRIAIARALAIRPKLIVCDEPTSALDVSVQAQILNLLKALQREMGIAYVFITHNIAVVNYIADEILIMYLGRIVEQGVAKEVLSQPAHPYTKALLAAVPTVGRMPRELALPLPGEMPSPANPPSGCHFSPRCPKATSECHQEYPPMVSTSATRKVACWLYGKRTSSAETNSIAEHA